MALSLKRIPLTLGAGVDTKTDPKNLPPGTPTVLENANFTNPGEIRPRFGYTALTAPASTGNDICAFGNQLLALAGARLYSRGVADSSWTNVGEHVPLGIDSAPLVSTTSGFAVDQFCPSYAESDGIELIVWRQYTYGLITGPTIYYAIRDTATGAFLVSPTTLSGFQTDVRAVVFGTKVVAYGVGSAANTIKLRSWTASTVASPVDLTIGTDLDTTTIAFDADSSSSGLIVAYLATGGAVFRYIRITSSLVLDFGDTFTAVLPVAGGVAVCCNTTNTFIFGYNGTDLKYKVVASTLVTTVVRAETTIASFALTGVTPLFRVGAVSTATTTATAYYSRTDTQANTVYRATVTTGGAVTSAVFKRVATIFSKPWVDDSAERVALGFASVTQGQIFVCTSSGTTIGKIGQGLYPTSETAVHLPTPCITVDSKRRLPWPRMGETFLIASVVSAYSSIALATIDKGAALCPPLALKNNVLFPGGVLRHYDGVNLCEHGYNLYPEVTASVTQVSVSIVAGDGGSGEASTFVMTEGSRINAYDGATVAEYFLFYSTTVNYYCWFIVDLVGTDPAVGGATGISVSINSYDSGTAVATAVAAAINTALSPAIATATTSTTDVTITMAVFGNTTNATTGTLNSGGAMTAGSHQLAVTYEWVGSDGAIYRSAYTSLTVTPGSKLSATLKILNPHFSEKTGVRAVVYKTVATSGTVLYKYAYVSVPTTAPYTYLFLRAADSGLTANDPIYTNGGVLENIAPPSCKSICQWNNRVVVGALEETSQAWYSKTNDEEDALAFNDELVIHTDPAAGGIVAVSSLDEKLIAYTSTSIFALAGQGATNTGAQDDLGVPQRLTSDVGLATPRSLADLPDGQLFKSSRGYYMLDRALTAQYVGPAVDSYNADAVTSAVVVPAQNQVRFGTGNGVVVLDYFVRQWTYHTYSPGVGACMWRGVYTAIASNSVVTTETNAYTDPSATAITMKWTSGWMPLGGIAGYFRLYKIILTGEFRSAHALEVTIWRDFVTTTSEVVTITVNTLDTVAGQLYMWVAQPTTQLMTAVKIQVKPTGHTAEALRLSSIMLEVGMQRAAGDKALVDGRKKG